MFAGISVFTLIFLIKTGIEDLSSSATGFSFDSKSILLINADNLKSIDSSSIESISRNNEYFNSMDVIIFYH